MSSSSCSLSKLVPNKRKGRKRNREPGNTSPPRKRMKMTTDTPDSVNTNESFHHSTTETSMTNPKFSRDELNVLHFPLTIWGAQRTLRDAVTDYMKLWSPYQCTLIVKNGATGTFLQPYTTPITCKLMMSFKVNTEIIQCTKLSMVVDREYNYDAKFIPSPCVKQVRIKRNLDVTFMPPCGRVSHTEVICQCFDKKKDCRWNELAPGLIFAHDMKPVIQSHHFQTTLLRSDILPEALIQLLAEFIGSPMLVTFPNTITEVRDTAEEDFYKNVVNCFRRALVEARAKLVGGKRFYRVTARRNQHVVPTEKWSLVRDRQMGNSYRFDGTVTGFNNIDLNKIQTSLSCDLEWRFHAAKGIMTEGRQEWDSFDDMINHLITEEITLLKQMKLHQLVRAKSSIKAVIGRVDAV